MTAEDEDDKPGEPSERRVGQDRRRRPPVTIDLTAEPAGDKAASAGASKPGTDSPPASDTPEPEKPAEEPAREAEPPPPPPPPQTPQTPQPPRPEPSRRRPIVPPSDAWPRLAAAGAVGGVVALLLVLILQLVGILPAPGQTEARKAADEAASLTDTAAGLDRRLTAAEAMTDGLPALRSELAAATERLAALEKTAGTLAAKSDVDAVASDVAALRAEVNATPAPASAADLSALAMRVQKLEAAPPPPAQSGGAAEASGALTVEVDDIRSRLTALSARVDAAEKSLSGLAQSSASASASQTAARAAALASLRRSAGAGEPLAADLDVLDALGVAPEATAQLRPYADKGVPTAAALAAEFDTVGDAIVAASDTPDDGGNVIDRLVAGARGLVSVRPAGPIPGDNPTAIVSRMRASMANGDLATALSERESLPQAGKDASAAWAAKVEARATVDRTIEEIAMSLRVAGGGR